MGVDHMLSTSTMGMGNEVVKMTTESFFARMSMSAFDVIITLVVMALTILTIMTLAYFFIGSFKFLYIKILKVIGMPLNDFKWHGLFARIVKPETKKEIINE